jgi:CelD/BcsL family acetyltransferase involved in cellulose biosynthesis
MKIERITTYEKFGEFKREWNGLLVRSGQNRPFLTHQWFDAWWQSFGHQGEMGILFFKDDTGNLVGIAPLMATQGKHRFLASQEVTDYCDFIFLKDDYNSYHDYLWDYLSGDDSGCADLELINIPESSPTISNIGESVGRNNWIREVFDSEVIPVLSLPGSYDEFLQNLGRKNRHELRRKKRRFESLGNVRIERITAPDMLNPAIDEFITLHSASSPAKREFWAMQGMPAFFLRVCRLFARESWVELFRLWLEARTIAALLSFSYEGTQYFYNIAYDIEFSGYSPGFYLFDYAIERAIEKGFNVANFLRGGEKYKYFFGAKESKIYSLKLIRREKRP